MKVSKRLICFIASPILLFLSSLTLLIWGNPENRFISYFTLPFSTILTFSVALLFTCFFTQERVKERKRIDVFFDILQGMETLLQDERFVIRKEEDLEGFVRIQQRTIKNKIDLLNRDKGFLQKYGIESAMECISTQFTNYWDLVSNHIDTPELYALNKDYVNSISKIIDRIEEIKYALYFSKK